MWEKCGQQWTKDTHTLARGRDCSRKWAGPELSELFVSPKSLHPFHFLSTLHRPTVAVLGPTRNTEKTRGRGERGDGNAFSTKVWKVKRQGSFRKASILTLLRKSICIKWLNCLLPSDLQCITGRLCWKPKPSQKKVAWKEFALRKGWPSKDSPGWE